MQTYVTIVELTAAGSYVPSSKKWRFKFPEGTSLEVQRDIMRDGVYWLQRMIANGKIAAGSTEASSVAAKSPLKAMVEVCLDPEEKGLKVLDFDHAEDKKRFLSQVLRADAGYVKDIYEVTVTDPKPQLIYNCTTNGFSPDLSDIDWVVPNKSFHIRVSNASEVKPLQGLVVEFCRQLVSSLTYRGRYDGREIQYSTEGPGGRDSGKLVVPDRDALTRLREEKSAAAAAAPAPALPPAEPRAESLSLPLAQNPDYEPVLPDSERPPSAEELNALAALMSQPLVKSVELVSAGPSAAVAASPGRAAVMRAASAPSPARVGAASIGRSVSYDAAVSASLPTPSQLPAAIQLLVTSLGITSRWCTIEERDARLAAGTSTSSTPFVAMLPGAALVIGAGAGAGAAGAAGGAGKRGREGFDADADADATAAAAPAAKKGTNAIAAAAGEAASARLASAIRGVAPAKAPGLGDSFDLNELE